MEKTAVLDALQVAHDKYFQLLLEHYPLGRNDGPFADFGPPELFDLAIEVHSCAIALGPKARDRLFFLGLDLLYPFDNPVDIYNWRAKVKKEKIEYTTYASIAIRIDSELKRMRRVFSLDGSAAYDSLPTEAFLVSKERYKPIDADEHQDNVGRLPIAGKTSTVHVDTMNVYAADSQAVSQLEKIEKGSAIGANFSNVVTALRTLIVG